MPSIHCRRCERTVEGFARSPLPGPHAGEIEANTCRECFQDWVQQEVMIINEYKLELANAQHQEMLNQEMARFLRLPSAPDDAEAKGPPPEFRPS